MACHNFLKHVMTMELFAGFCWYTIPIYSIFRHMVYHGIFFLCSSGQHQHPKMMANSQHISTSININIYQGLSHISHGFKKYPSISLKQQPGPCPLVPPGEERQPDGLYRVTR